MDLAALVTYILFNSSLINFCKNLPKAISRDVLINRWKDIFTAFILWFLLIFTVKNVMVQK